MLTTNPRDSFNTQFDGYPAVIFDNTAEYNNFRIKLERDKLSFRTKIVKGKRAGKKRRQFVVMLVNNHGH